MCDYVGPIEDYVWKCAILIELSVVCSIIREANKANYVMKLRL